LDQDPAWNEIRAALRGAVGERTFGLWLEPLHYEGRSGDTLRLSGPPEVSAWASERLGSVLQSCAQAVLGPAVSVVISGAGAPPASAPPDPVASPRTSAERALNPKYTFEQFVIGNSNRFAHAAALSVAETPAQAYNPLFIYGPPGLGKTHLLHAIGNYVQRFGGGLRVRYTTVEAFTNEFVSALGSGSIGAFKAAFRDSDVLLIDDVEFLERKARTEEEFFHTFNALYDSGRQLVITSDRQPSDLEALAARLRERFESGLVTDIGRPDYATRLTILRKRAAHDGLTGIDPEALEVLAAGVTANVRALEGAVIRVVAYASLTSEEVTPQIAAEVLQRIAPREAREAPPTIAAVQEAVCAFFGITLDELLARTRSPRLTWPRHAAMYLARELTDHSLPVIGQAFGGRDHSTVLNAARRAAERMASHPDAYTAIEQLTASLTAGAAGAAHIVSTPAR
jgi:chromosomal replication initiator protein